jgi:hypothetical protein
MLFRIKIARDVFFKKTTILYISFALICPIFCGQPINKVLIIGIDGCRVDALLEAETPTIDSLRKHGIFTPTCWQLGKTKSGPGWSSMLTGVWDPKHKVHNNRFSNHAFNDYPFFPRLLREKNAAVKSTIVMNWKALQKPAALYGWNQSIAVSSDEEGKNTLVELLKNENSDVLMVHFNDVDFTGHLSGFELDNPKYLEAIERVDHKIGEILGVLRSRPNYAKENWLILLSSDHGGTGRSHSRSTVQERKVWWLASAPFLPVLEITSSDPGSYYYPELPIRTHQINYCPTTVDLAVTAIDHVLNGFPYEDYVRWGLDGKSWLNLDLAKWSNEWNKVEIEMDENQLQWRNYIGKNVQLKELIQKP